MEKQLTSCDPTSPYSIRISKIDTPNHLLGTGTLLIRREDKTAWLLTCAHVFFLTESTEVIKAVNIEYAYPAEKHLSGRRQTLDLSTSVVMAGELRKTDKIEEDFVCLKLPWELWMENIPDTVFAVPTAGDILTGYGFPQRNNEEYTPNCSVMQAIDDIRAVSHIPDADGYFIIKYKAFHAEDRDIQSVGFSGTGLFNERKQLVGMVSAPNGHGSGVFEMKAFPASRLKKYWDRCREAIPLERISLFWCIREPNRFLFHSLCQRVNLFYLLGGIRGPAVLLLLNHQGRELDQSLSMLDTLLPYREWTRFDLSASSRFAPEEMKDGGAVISMAFRRRDWWKAEEFLDSRWEEAGCLLLFCVDISPESESEFIPGNTEKDNLEKAWDEIPSFFREHIYYLLSTTCFVDKFSDTDTNTIQSLLDQAEKDLDPYQFLFQYLKKHSSAYYDVMKLCTHSKSETLRIAGCRLVILYGLLGKPFIHSFFSVHDSGFLKNVFFDILNQEEKVSFLGQLALANNNAANTILNAICEDPLLSAGKADLAEMLWTLAQERPWTREFLEQRLDSLTHPVLRQVLLYLNDSRRTQADYNALLSLLKDWTDQSFYWRVRLCSRWGVQQLPAVYSEGGEQFAAMLLSPQPDMTDSTAWDYAATIRGQLFS